MADDQTTEELTRAIQELQQTFKDTKSVDPKEMDKVNKALSNCYQGIQSSK